jgi:hypothetical protein
MVMATKVDSRAMGVMLEVKVVGLHGYTQLICLLQLL